MSAAIFRRVVSTLVGTGVLLGCALGASPSASASSLYACVKKNGSAHVYAKKPKCKKGESKLSWNSQGAPGKNGTNGTDGKEGAAGKEGPAGPEKLLSFSPLSLENGWIDAAGTERTSPVGYAIDGFGEVHLRGGVESPSPTGAIATLPVGARPLYEIFETSWGWDAETPTFIRITPGGAILVIGTGESLTAVKKFAGLDGVTFFTH